MIIKKCLMLAAVASAQCYAADVPSQYMAKLYSEGLGRAPDAEAWQSMTNYFLDNGCSTGTLRQMAAHLFSSDEYINKGYTNEEALLTVFRAIFSREPDPAGFAYWLDYARTGKTAAQLAHVLSSSEEFGTLAGSICHGGSYISAGSQGAPIDIGAGTWTQARLESCLAENTVCSVPPRTVVYLDSTLTIPAGKTLETAGGFERRMYARQARIVRNSSFRHTLVVMQAGSTVRNVWVTGGRDRFKDELKSDPTPSTPMNDVFANINYVGGNHGLISGIRSDSPLSATHISSYPVLPSATDAFYGVIEIRNNLTTGYAHSHYRDDDTNIPWADGISQHIRAGSIVDNDIIDPTDVGIVIFGHDDSTQSSTAANNIVVHAGHSAYGSLGLDTTQCVKSHTGCQFSGSGFTGNLIFGGEKQHSDIVLFNGTAAWLTPQCTGILDSACGKGGQMTNNRTIPGDANQVLPAQVAISVDGMIGAVTAGHEINVVQVPAASDMRCRAASGELILNSTGKGHAGGMLQAGASGDVDGCIGH